ncbi:MAG: GNAT family N-acetyltransferase [Polyangiaceae bacterium]|nr:GNAT family N-acetyltransferase [Polyangiaceae bacterium]
MTPTIERLGRESLLACVELADACGWSDELSDWRPLFAAAEVTGVRRDGALVACCTRAPLGAVAVLGKLLVRPDARRRGLARALVTRAIEASQGAVVSLVATDEGRPLYDSLGFSPVGEIVALDGRLAADGPPLPPDVTLGAFDLTRAVELDRALTSCDRGELLRARAAEAVQAWSAFRGGEFVGYAMATSHPERRLVGPVIARDPSLGAALVCAVAGIHRVRVHVPSFHWATVEALTTRGLEVTARRAELTLGGVASPLATPARVALASQALG